MDLCTRPTTRCSVVYVAQRGGSGILSDVIRRAVTLCKRVPVPEIWPELPVRLRPENAAAAGLCLTQPHDPNRGHDRDVRSSHMKKDVREVLDKLLKEEYKFSTL